MATTLLLNSDAQPLSFLPLSTIRWQEAICYLVSEKAVALEWYDDWIVRSERWQTAVPAVMILKNYQRKKAGMRFSKRNVLLRDKFKCAYCGADVTHKTGTVDHILPLSHGGKNTWENCVCACGRCNSQKGNNLQIRPKKTPTKPTYHQLVEHRKLLPFEGGHPSWAGYLGIDS